MPELYLECRNAWGGTHTTPCIQGCEWCLKLSLSVTKFSPLPIPNPQSRMAQLSVIMRMSSFWEYSGSTCQPSLQVLDYCWFSLYIYGEYGQYCLQYCRYKNVYTKIFGLGCLSCARHGPEFVQQCPRWTQLCIPTLIPPVDPTLLEDHQASSG